MSRDAKLIAALTSVALLCAGVVAGYFVTFEPPPVRVVSGPSLPRAQQVSVEFLGDTMLGDAATPTLRRHGYDWAFRHVQGFIDADVVLANLEAPITSRAPDHDPLKDYNYRVRPEAAAALADVGIDAVTLGNNHAMDAGALGVADTRSNLAASGVKAYGAGRNLAAARRPLLVRSAAGNIAVVPIGEDFGSDVTAGPAQAGTVALSPDTVQRGYDDAIRAGADWVVAQVHWGDNYALTNRSQRYWARSFARTGYDLVVGTGPHIPNSVAVLGDMPVAYSIGNFAFGSPGRFPTRRLGVGLTLRATFRAGLPPSVSFGCLSTDNDVVDYQPRPCGPRRRAATWRLLGPDVVPRGSVGVLTVPAPPARDTAASGGS